MRKERSGLPPAFPSAAAEPSSCSTTPGKVSAFPRQATADPRFLTATAATQKPPGPSPASLPARFTPQQAEDSSANPLVSDLLPDPNSKVPSAEPFRERCSSGFGFTPGPSFLPARFTQQQAANAFCGPTVQTNVVVPVAEVPLPTRFGKAPLSRSAVEHRRRAHTSTGDLTGISGSIFPRPVTAAPSPGKVHPTASSGRLPRCGCPDKWRHSRCQSTVTSPFWESASISLRS